MVRVGAMEPDTGNREPPATNRFAIPCTRPLRSTTPSGTFPCAGEVLGRRGFVLAEPRDVAGGEGNLEARTQKPLPRRDHVSGPGFPFSVRGLPLIEPLLDLGAVLRQVLVQTVSKLGSVCLRGERQGRRLRGLRLRQLQCDRGFVHGLPHMVRDACHCRSDKAWNPEEGIVGSGVIHDMAIITGAELAAVRKSEPDAYISW